MSGMTNPQHETPLGPDDKWPGPAFATIAQDWERLKEWPNEQLVYEALANAWVRDNQHGVQGGGWRCLAELAGIIQCPEFARLLIPMMKLVAAGRVEQRGLETDSATVYRAKNLTRVGPTGEALEFFEGDSTGATWNGESK